MCLTSCTSTFSILVGIGLTDFPHCQLNSCNHDTSGHCTFPLQFLNLFQTSYLRYTLLLHSFFLQSLSAFPQLITGMPLLSRSFAKSSEKSFSVPPSAAKNLSGLPEIFTYSRFRIIQCLSSLPCPATIYPLRSILLCFSSVSNCFWWSFSFLLYNFFLCIHQDFIIFVEVFLQFSSFRLYAAVKVPECLPYGIGLFLFFIFRNL